MGRRIALRKGVEAVWERPFDEPERVSDEHLKIIARRFVTGRRGV